jgi:hypothetical protein
MRWQVGDVYTTRPDRHDSSDAHKQGWWQEVYVIDKMTPGDQVDMSQLRVGLILKSVTGENVGTFLQQMCWGS